MRHLIFSMQANDPAPAAGMRMEPWFYTFKWQIDDDYAFVPFPAGTDAGPGDCLWFVMDDELLGGVQLIGTSLCTETGQTELRYRGQDIFVLPPDAQVPCDLVTGELDISSEFYATCQYWMCRLAPS